MPSRALYSAACACIAFGAVAMTSSPASADIIAISSDNGLEGLGVYSGSIEYDSTTFQLTITLTNDSNPANGGFITGLVFNIGSADANATATLSSATYAFTGVTNELAAPFGTFDAGAALGGSWLGGGSPQGGIAVGDTGTFVFDVSAADAMSLTAASFIGDEGATQFVVRFKGFEDGGSDKVVGIGGDAIIPGPSVLALMALSCIMLRRRRRDEAVTAIQPS